MLLFVTACSKTEYADTLEPDALMKLVFKGWQADSIVKRPILKIQDDGFNKNGMYLAPVKVLKLADDRAVLLTRAIPEDTGKISRDVLAAYWFKRDGEKWLLEARQDDIDSLRSVQEIKAVKIIELAPARQGLLIEYSQSQRGETDVLARLYMLRQHQITTLLPENQDFMLLMKEFNHADCTRRMKKAPGKPERVRLNDREGRDGNCLDIQVKLELKPGKDLPGEIVLSANAKMFEYREIERHDLPDANGEYFTSYEVIPSAPRSTMVFHYDEAKGKYQRVSGSRSFLPDWYRE
ncbi:hypothetical protein DFR42_10353 [Undibacterium pigrum]|uniref:Uncharacterized protein n=2 Tax=Undibacterium pigrum TaxID=401470 RepID=A0A318J6X6_9BURK|nr:hypothetical protein DFR42_10353 [Undibacterium pigrum]